MNRLIIVGNGFDKSLEMMTAYGDFLDSIFTELLQNFFGKRFTENEYCRIEANTGLFPKEMPSKDFTGKQFFEMITDTKYQFTIRFKSNFFERIVKKWAANWVDIEMEFFNELVARKGATMKGDESKLLSDFELLCNKLEEYLGKEKIPWDFPLENYRPIFDPGPNLVPKLATDIPPIYLILNFNYTSSIRDTLGPLLNNPRLELIHIHGELNSESNPIIFGFGDEHDTRLKGIENNLNTNAQKRIKSYSYMQTRNYSLLGTFMQTEFVAHIVGHSLGLSDRTLLKEIFGNPNCKRIQIHYRDKGTDGNDFFDKCVALNSHFDNKIELRQKVVNFEDCTAMPQIKSITEQP